MGAPSTSISQIFLQHIEHLAQKHKVVNYFWYIDDTLLIYESQHTDIRLLLHDFDSVHPNLQFTQEVEQNNAINYMDITIHKTPMNIKISVYRKPTFTDTINPYTSNHHTQHKHAAVRFLYNRPDAYQLHTAEYQHEENIIQNILHNSFPILPPKKKKKERKKKQQQQGIMKISQTLVDQNYFQFQDKIYIQKGLITGALTSSIFSEIYF